MQNNFNVRFKTFQVLTTKALLVLVPLLFIAAVFISKMSFFWGWCALALLIVLNSIWVVPTGFVGFAMNRGKLKNHSFKPGFCRKWPIISDTYLMDTRVLTKTINDIKKVITRNNVELEAVFTYQIIEQWAFLIFRQMGPNYYETHISKWIDAIFDTIISRLTYAHLQGDKAEVERIVSCMIEYELAKKSSDITEELYPGKTFKVTGYEMRDYKLLDNPDYDPKVLQEYIAVPNPNYNPTDPSSTKFCYTENPDYDPTGPKAEEQIRIPLTKKLSTGGEEPEIIHYFELDEAPVTLPGVNLFKNVSLKINKVKFEDSYEEARAKVAQAKARTKQVEEEQKQILMQAEANKKATILEAEGDAEAKRMKGEAENAIREQLGKILKENPKLIQEDLAKNFPKVFGATNTMINLDDMLK